MAESSSGFHFRQKKDKRIKRVIVVFLLNHTLSTETSLTLHRINATLRGCVKVGGGDGSAQVGPALVVEDTGGYREVLGAGHASSRRGA